MSTTIPASAYILIGGKSLRFGSPKWQAEIQKKSVLNIIWNACNIFENRYVVGKENPTQLNKPFIRDELSINAPINGLYSALNHSKTDWIYLLSCDLPLMTSHILKSIWDSKKDESDVIIPIANKKTQTTCGLYNKRILPILEDEIQNNSYSIYKLLEKTKRQHIHFGNNIHFTNMNTLDDYQFIQSYILKQL